MTKMLVANDAHDPGPEIRSGRTSELLPPLRTAWRPASPITARTSRKPQDGTHVLQR